jgi:hypothetical protein
MSVRNFMNLNSMTYLDVSQSFVEMVPNVTLQPSFSSYVLSLQSHIQ